MYVKKCFFRIFYFHSRVLFYLIAKFGGDTAFTASPPPVFFRVYGLCLFLYLNTERHALCLFADIIEGIYACITEHYLKMKMRLFCKL